LHDAGHYTASAHLFQRQPACVAGFAKFSDCRETKKYRRLLAGKAASLGTARACARTMAT
jgi:hypothetical protein